MSHRSPDFQPLLKDRNSATLGQRGSESPFDGHQVSNWSQSPPLMPVIRWRVDWGWCSCLLSVKLKRGMSLSKDKLWGSDISEKEKKKESISFWKWKKIFLGVECANKVCWIKRIYNLRCHKNNPASFPHSCYLLDPLSICFYNFSLQISN